MRDGTWEKEVLTMTKHKLFEALEKLNKEDYQDEEAVHTYKEALKALYYLMNIEKAE